MIISKVHPENKKNWWKESVVYQIYPRSFKDSNGDGIGDLQGIIEKLDYLAEVGVDVIWLCPIYASPNVDNGYDISDYKKIMPDFGTMQDFEMLLNEVHKRGLKIIMDMVVNHTSDEHEWFQKSKQGIVPYKDYYIWREGKKGEAPNNWRSNFSGPAWTFDDSREMYYLHLFHKRQPELNWECDELRAEIYEMMRWWLDKGVDGFRLDVINYIGKDQRFPDGEIGCDGFGDFVPYAVNQENSHRYLEEMQKNVFSKYNVMTVGETPFVNTVDAIRYADIRGKELNMIFQFEHMDIDNAEDGSKWSDRRIALPDLKKCLCKWQEQLEGKAWNSLYWCNHDQPRPVSRLGNDKNAFLWKKSAKMLATCLHMLKGTPYIFQGEEIGMTNYPFENIEDVRDIESINAYKDYIGRGTDTETMMSFIRNKGRDNARTPMQWNGSKNAGFSSGNPWIRVNPNYESINVNNQLKDADSVLNYYKRMISLRKKLPVIIDGVFSVYKMEHPAVFVYKRENGDSILWVACNFSENIQDITIPIPSNSRLVCANYEDRKVKKIEEKIVMEAYEAVAFLFRK